MPNNYDTIYFQELVSVGKYNTDCGFYSRRRSKIRMTGIAGDRNDDRVNREKMMKNTAMKIAM